MKISGQGIYKPQMTVYSPLALNQSVLPSLFPQVGRMSCLFFYLKAGTLIGVSIELYEVLESC